MEGIAAWKIAGKSDPEEMEWILPNVEDNLQTAEDPESIPSDLILVGEFSELEGPVPLLTIPPNFNKLSRPQPFWENHQEYTKAHLCQNCQQMTPTSENINNIEYMEELPPRKSLQSEVPLCDINHNPLDFIQFKSCSCSIRTNKRNYQNEFSIDQNAVPRHPSTSRKFSEENNMHLDNNCDIFIEKMSDEKSYITCSVHANSTEHKCSCEIFSQPEKSKTLKFYTHEQNPMYHGININDLILKLMSTDYQTSSGPFKISTDTEVIEEDLHGPFSGIGAVIRYVTLYDSQARGFVRPLCIAYLTWDRTKINHRLDAIRFRLKKASAHLKACNLPWFGWELLERLADLHLTKDRFVAALQKIGYPNCRDCLPTRVCTKCRACGVTQLDTENRNTNANISKSLHNLNSPCKESMEEQSPEKCDDEVFESGVSETFDSNLLKGHSQLSKSSPDITGIDRGTMRTQADKNSTKLSDSDLLQHTTLTNLASQLLDCKKMLSVVIEYLKSNELLPRLREILWSISNEPDSKIYDLLRKWNVIHGTYVTIPILEDQIWKNECDSKNFNVHGCLDISNCSNACIITKLADFMNHPIETFKTLLNPKPFLMSLSRRRFKDLRSFRILSGPGFVSAVVQLVKLHETQKKSAVSLAFQKIDKHCYSNDPGTLFIGNIPIVNVLKCTPFLGLEDTRPESPDPEINYKSPKPSINNLESSFKFSTSSDSNFIEVLSVLWSDNCVKSSMSPEQRTDDLLNISLLCKVCHRCIACVGEDLTEVTETQNSSTSSDGRLLLSSAEWSSSYGSEYNPRDPWRRQHKREGAGRNDFSFMGRQNEEPRNSSSFYKYHPRVCVDERIVNATKYRLADAFVSSTHVSPSVSLSLIASLLSGRRLLVAARSPGQKAVERLISALSSGCLPVGQDNTFPVTKYHKGVVTSHHLHHQPLLGLCIPDRLELCDLMDPHTLETLTIVNQSTGHISGVAYCGKFLRGLKEFRVHMNLRSQLISSPPPVPPSSSTQPERKRKQSSASAEVSHQRSESSQRGVVVRSVSSPNISDDSSFCLNPSSRFDSSTIENIITLVDCKHQPTFNTHLHDASDLPRVPDINVPFQTFLQSQFVRAGMKIYLFFHVCGNSTIPPQKLMSLLGVEERNDRKILEYLTSIVCRQIDLADVDVEYKP